MKFIGTKKFLGTKFIKTFGIKSWARLNWSRLQRMEIEDLFPEEVETGTAEIRKNEAVTVELIRTFLDSDRFTADHICPVD